VERKRRLSLLVLVFASIAVVPSPAADPSGKVTAVWDKVLRISQTTPTLQVVVNPPLRRGTPVHDNAFKALRDLPTSAPSPPGCTRATSPPRIRPTRTR
jgi:hypothetical protein